MRKFIKSRRNWTTPEGEEKAHWYIVGEIFEAHGKEYVRLNANPNLLYYVYENEDRDIKEAPQKPQPTPDAPPGYSPF